MSARVVQKVRYKSSDKYNASLASNEIKQLTAISTDAKNLLLGASTRLGLTARSYFKVIKVAQTIADLAGSPTIEPAHIAEALQYRVAPPG